MNWSFKHLRAGFEIYSIRGESTLYLHTIHNASCIPLCVCVCVCGRLGSIFPFSVASGPSKALISNNTLAPQMEQRADKQGMQHWSNNRDSVQSTATIPLYIHRLAIPLTRLLVAFCSPHVLLLGDTCVLFPGFLLFWMDGGWTWCFCWGARFISGVTLGGMEAVFPRSFHSQRPDSIFTKLTEESGWKWFSRNVEKTASKSPLPSWEHHVAASVYWTVYFHTKGT